MNSDMKTMLDRSDFHKQVTLSHLQDSPAVTSMAEGEQSKGKLTLRAIRQAADNLQETKAVTMSFIRSSLS